MILVAVVVAAAAAAAEVEIASAAAVVAWALAAVGIVWVVVGEAAVAGTAGAPLELAGPVAAVLVGRPGPVGRSWPVGSAAAGAEAEALAGSGIVWAAVAEAWAGAGAGAGAGAVLAAAEAAALAGAEIVLAVAAEVAGAWSVPGSAAVQDEVRSGTDEGPQEGEKTAAEAVFGQTRNGVRGFALRSGAAVEVEALVGDPGCRFKRMFSNP